MAGTSLRMLLRGTAASEHRWDLQAMAAAEGAALKTDWGMQQEKAKPKSRHAPPMIRGRGPLLAPREPEPFDLAPNRCRRA